MSNLKEGRNK